MYVLTRLVFAVAVFMPISGSHKIKINKKQIGSIDSVALLSLGEAAENNAQQGVHVEKRCAKNKVKGYGMPMFLLMTTAITAGSLYYATTESMDANNHLLNQIGIATQDTNVCKDALDAYASIEKSYNNARTACPYYCGPCLCNCPSWITKNINVSNLLGL